MAGSNGAVTFDLGDLERQIQGHSDFEVSYCVNMLPCSINMT